MAIAQVDQGVNIETSTSTTPNTVTLDGGAPSQGEVIYLALGFVAGSAASYPTSVTSSGFTEIAQVDGGAGDFGQLTLLRKVAGASEPSSYAIAWSGGTDYSTAAAAVVYSGVDNTTPEGTAVTAQDESTGFTWDIPALTTTEDNSYDLALVASQADNTTTTGAFLSSWGSSLVERVDQMDDFAGIGIADALRASAGVQAATSTTSSASNASLAIRVELFEDTGGPAGTNTIIIVPTGPPIS